MEGACAGVFPSRIRTAMAGSINNGNILVRKYLVVTDKCWKLRHPAFQISPLRKLKGIKKEKCFLDFTELPMEIYEGLLLCSFESVEYRESSPIANICNEECLDGC